MTLCTRVELILVETCEVTVMPVVFADFPSAEDFDLDAVLECRRC